MRIFISFSGDRSRAVAEALYDWLPRVIQAVKPWLSARDVEKGVKWNNEIVTQLEALRFGIICLAKDNLERPWINFEAGALSMTKRAEGVRHATHVCTYLLDLEPTDVPQPLAQFNATRAERDDTRKLVDTINRGLESGALSERILDEQFERMWPKLQEDLFKIPPTATPRPSRKDRELLEEILELSRAQARGEHTQKLLAGMASYFRSSPNLPQEMRRFMASMFGAAAAMTDANSSQGLSPVSNALLYDRASRRWLDLTEEERLIRRLAFQLYTSNQPALNILINVAQHSETPQRIAVGLPFENSALTEALTAVLCGDGLLQESQLEPHTYSATEKGMKVVAALWDVQQSVLETQRETS